MIDSSNVTDEELRVFLDEADEHLQVLDESVLKLEKDSQNQQLLQGIFRAAHTLKGSSGAIGLTDMAEITHYLEDIFDAIRKNLLKVDSQLVDVIFECLDVLRKIKQNLVENKESDTDYSELIDKLEKIYSKAEVKNKKKPTADKQKKVEQPLPDIADLFPVNQQFKQLVDDERLKKQKIFYIFTRFIPTCQMVAVRAFQVINELLSSGQVMLANPTVDDIYKENVSDHLGVIFSSEKQLYQIEELVNNIDELQDIAIKEVLDIDVSDKKNDIVTAGNEELVIDKNISKIGRTIRVDVERLDSIMNLVGELVIDRTRIHQLGSEIQKKYEADQMTSDMLESSLRIGRITAELQEEIMKARMLPIGNVFSKFPRVVRDIAKRCEKKINFVIEGQSTELDRSVIEEIGDPLIHLLRNAIDHGIEDVDVRKKRNKSDEGFVRLSAFHEDNYIVIKVEDDGNGIDEEGIKKKAIEKKVISEERAERMSKQEAINLIFLSGITTAKTVSDISGRGVGMDVVRNNIEKINGQVLVNSEFGRGLTVTIRLPLTLAIIQALLIKVSGRVYAIPLTSVQETIQVNPDEIQKLRTREAIILRGNVLPLLRLADGFYPDRVRDEEKQREKNKKMYVVVVSMGDKQVGFVVDFLIGEQEIVIKNLNKYLGEIKGISGATILGDGRVALIIDVMSLVHRVISEQLMAVHS